MPPTIAEEILGNAAEFRLPDPRPLTPIWSSGDIHQFSEHCAKGNTTKRKSPASLSGFQVTTAIQMINNRSLLCRP